MGLSHCWSPCWTLEEVQHHGTALWCSCRSIRPSLCRFNVCDDQPSSFHPKREPRIAAGTAGVRKRTRRQPCLNYFSPHHPGKTSLLWGMFLFRFWCLHMNFSQFNLTDACCDTAARPRTHREYLMSLTAGCSPTLTPPSQKYTIAFTTRLAFPN